MKKIILLLCIIFFICHFSYSEQEDSSYIDITSFAKNYGLRISYSFLKDRVLLYKNSLKISARPGLDIILVNDKVSKMPYQVKKINGIIYLPRQIISSINESVEPDLTIPHEQSQSENGINNISEANTNLINDNQKFVVILDPGHGGKDPGCINQKFNIYEKDLVLPVALFVYKYLKKNSNIKVILTRKNDVFLDLEERANIANGKLSKGVKAIFISFHINYSVFNPQSSGVETFYYSPQNFSSEREKKILNFRLKNISQIYYDGKLSGNNLEIASRTLEIKLGNESKNLARTIQKKLTTNNKFNITDRGVKRDKFFVLAHTVMPSVLIELGFLSNDKETKSLLTKKYQKFLAANVGKAILNYINTYR